MKNKAWEIIKKYNMLEKGDSVLVAFSGGADSSALLHYLISIRKVLSLDIYACHINHGIRGEEADKDEAFTIDFCNSMKVPVFTYHISVPELAREKGVSEELCGREARYEILKRKSDELNAKIATAHTASDLSETIIFNLVRGSGISGLCGIPPVRGNIIRPLISSSRADIEAYCRENGLNYVTDSTNLSREYTRNKLRLDVLPVLREINPSLDMSLYGFSERLRDVNEYIRYEAGELIKRARNGQSYSVSVMLDSNKAVRAEALRIIFSEFDIIPESRHIELLEKIMYNGGALEVRRGVFAVSRSGYLDISRRKPAEKKKYEESVILSVGEEFIIADKKISTKLSDLSELYKGEKNNNFIFDNLLDYDTIPLSAVFRTRRAGDRFRLPKRHITKEVRMLFKELKTEPEKRDGIILLAEGNDVLWIEGIGASEVCSITERTQKTLIINVQDV